VPIQSANQPEIFTLEQFAGVNQHNRRASINDQELWWCENLFPTTSGSLRSMWGPSAPVYTAPAGDTIRRIFFGYYGNKTPLFQQPPPGRQGWMFLDSGNVDEVDLDTGQVTRVGQIWEPIAPKYWAAAKVWRPRYVGHALGEVGGVLFGSPLGLYAWDGVNLYSPGDPAPDWLSNDDITQPVIPTVMPVGLVNIYAMEVYQERLWIAGKTVIQFSAPQNGADFAASDGGGSFGYFGDKLVHDYMDLAASTGYLYIFGDSSTDVVANVQLAGAGTPTDPFITNFNYSNIDPITGQRFPRPVGRWGRYFLMFNGAGIWEMQGGDAQLRSEKIANLYMTIDSAEFYPTMCAVTMFDKRCLLVNCKCVDPFGVKRSMLLCWDGQKWWTASQHYNLTNIASYEDNSVITAYGTDGTNLYRLFDHPDPTLLKRLSTKAWRGTQPAMLTMKYFKRAFMELHDNSGQGWQRQDSQTVISVPRNNDGVAIIGTVTTSGGGIPNGTEDIGFELTQGKGYGLLPWPLSGSGIAVEMDLNSLSPDFTIERLHVMGEQRTLYGA
jgi:hypothetical protein